MTTPLAEYRFLSWVRRGIAAELAAPAAATLPARATVQTEINLQGTPVPGASGTTALQVTAAAALYGPGDVVGIDRHHVVRTEPTDGTANFEPDYFAGLEFDQPDFPWLFTPAGATSNRLPPWVVLIALAASEFDPMKEPPGPLPAINIHDITTLPDLSESWAWAHGQLAVDVKDQTLDVAGLLRTHPELAASRILCPRHLTPETAYTAFLVPAYDVGKFAGLGQQTSSSATLNPSWTAQTPVPLQLPVYYQFSFHTSDQGDFESLVRRMQQRILPGSVGIRPMDVAHLDLGWGVGSASATPLGMGGALRSRQTTDTVWPDDTDPRGNAFQTELATLINVTGPGTDDPSAPGPEPLVVPPLYGRWLVAQTKLPGGGWVRELNLDPRRRAAAGLGTQVVLQERAQLIASARQQLEGVDKANQLLRQAQLVRSTLLEIVDKHFLSAPAETLLAFTSAVHARVLGSTKTVRAKLAESRLPLAALSAAFRRVSRPLGPVRRRQGATASPPHGVVKRLNDGDISAAPPIEPPGGMTSIDQTSDGLFPAWVPQWLRAILRFAPWLVLLLALLLALMLLVLGSHGGWLPLAAALAAALLAAAIWLATRLRGVAARARVAGRMRFAGLTPEAFAAGPQRPDFQIAAPGASPVTQPSGTTDSADAQAFRIAGAGFAAALHAPQRNLPPAPPADLETLRTTLLARLDPNITVPARVATMVKLAPALKWKPADPLAPIMAAPSFPQPMYVPLRDWSQDWLLPNVKEVPPDTMALIKTDHAFIEAYMVGLNQEMGRQLLWNRYPTDQRGTYFRQFWDVSSYVPAAGDPPAGSDALRQKLYDIPPVTSWPLGTSLGEHDNRAMAPDSLVLLIRGELLRRYPNAVIYACPAIAGDPNKNEPMLVLDPQGPELYPLFRGTMSPDLTFFGFALTAAQALGDAAHPKGWFFVFQQVPGEPRFGFEPSQPSPAEPIHQWAELSWANFGNGAGPGPAFASPAATPFNLVAGTLGTTPVSQTIQVEQDPDGTALNPNDVITKNNWGVDAAQIGYITMRLPARVAVPAGLMLAQ